MRSILFTIATVFIISQCVMAAVGISKPTGMRDEFQTRGRDSYLHEIQVDLDDSVKIKQAREKYQKEILKADGFISSEKYKNAIGVLMPLLATPEELGICRAAQQRLNQIYEVLKKEIDSAVELAGQGKKQEAVAILKKIYSDYKDLPPGKNAATELESLGVKADEPVQKLPPAKEKNKVEPSVVDEKKAKIMLKDAQKLEAEGDLLKAYKQFNKLKKSYPKTLAGKSAVENLKRLAADKKMKKLLKDEKRTKQCKSWIGIAENLMRNGKHMDAKFYLERVLDDYPDSKYAKKARELLEEIEKK